MKVIKQISSILFLCVIFTISEVRVYADTLTTKDIVSVDIKHENFNYNLKPAIINEKVSAAPNTIAEARGNVVNVTGGTHTNIIGGEGVDISDNTVNVTGNITLSGGIYGAYNKDTYAPNHATIIGNSLNINNAVISGPNADIKGVAVRSTATVTGNKINIDNLTFNLKSYTVTGIDVSYRPVEETVQKYTINDNIFTLSNVNFNKATKGIAMTTLASGEVDVLNNKVIVKNSTLGQFVGYEFRGADQGSDPLATPAKVVFEGNLLSLEDVTVTANLSLTFGITSSKNNIIEVVKKTGNSSVNGTIMGYHLFSGSASVPDTSAFIQSIGDTFVLDGVEVKGTSSRVTSMELAGIYAIDNFTVRIKDVTTQGQAGRGALAGIKTFNNFGSSTSYENSVINSNMSVFGNSSITQGVTLIDLTEPLGVTINNNNLFIGHNQDGSISTGTVKLGGNAVGVSLKTAMFDPKVIENATIDNNKVYAGGESVSINGDVKTISTEFEEVNKLLVTNNMLYLGMTPKNTNANVNITGNAYAVKSDALGTFQNNGVLISGNTTVTGSVYGVSSTGNKSTLNGNFVNVNGATSPIAYKLYGVSSTGAGSTITENKVIIDGAKSAITLNEGADLYGASSIGAESTLTNNIVSLDGTKNAITVNNIDIYGANTTQKNTLTGNTVQLLGQVNVTNTNKNIYGAFGNYGNLGNNRVILDAQGKNISVTSNIYGAYINSGVADTSIISNNEVVVLGNVSLAGNIFGAYNNIDGGTLDNNQIIIGNKTNATSITGTSTSNIYGAYADKNNTTLSNNFIGINDNVNINNASLNIYGAYAKGERGILSQNRLIIGEVQIYTDPAKEQTARIINPTVTIASNGIYGAYAENTSSNLTANEVIIASKTDINSSIYGAYAGATATESTLSKNRVVIVNDAKVTGSIYGAYAENGNVSLNGVSLGALTIDKGTINLTGDVYGGYAKVGTATENVVKLNGRNNFQNVAIYGGFSENNQDQVTGNKLLLNKFRGSVKSLNNFEEIEFQRDDEGFSSANVWKEDDIVINIKGGKTTNLNGTKFKNVPNLIADAQDKVYKDARMYLMYNEQGGLSNLNLGDHQGRLRHGYLRYYDYHLKGDDQSVQIILGKNDGGQVEAPKPNPEPEQQPGEPVAPVPPKPDKPNIDNRPEADYNIAPEAESFLGGRDALAIMVKRGGDMVAAINSNIIHPLETAESDKKYNIGTFFNTGGGYVQDEGKNTEIQVSRGAILTGIGVNFNQPIADIFLTTFFEGGYGTYSRTGMYNVSGEQVNVTADGKSDYYGGGFTLRSDFKVKPAHTVYIDSSFRGGETNYSYKAKNYADVNNLNAEYKSATAYYGAHLGTGYMYNLNDKYIFDVYAKYLFSYYDDDQVSLSKAEKIDFGSFSSHRLNSGLRVNFTTPIGITPYIGAGVEYQADENVTAIAYGKAITGHESTLDVMGTFEAGFTYSKQFEKLRLNLDVKGKGSAGALNSGAGSVDIRLDF